MSQTQRIAYGDFQTPEQLARRVTALLKDLDLHPTVIIEPTCGIGNFVHAALNTFGKHPRYIAFDINSSYLAQLRASLPQDNHTQITIETKNFFEHDWSTFFQDFQTDHILMLGNPPWVTNAKLGMIGSSNAPQKSNFQRYSGLAAKTGKANFDIAEWMLIKLLESLQGHTAWIAMLCKTATVRKVLRYAWEQDFQIGQSSLHLIDTNASFQVSVDACLFLTHIGAPQSTKEAAVYSSLDFCHKISRFEMYGTELVADIDLYQDVKEFDGASEYIWRSGIKHDAAKVIELSQKGSHFVNGFGEIADIEDDYIFPLLKSSDIANHRLIPHKYVILTQTSMGEDTAKIKTCAPKTWKYLVCYRDILQSRKSSIYKNRPPFSIFGVGKYSFAPWKVAVSGFYKQMRFAVLGQQAGKPIMVDDTCYFISCFSEAEAAFLTTLLNSERCQQLLRSLVFFDAKRPITRDILKRIDIKRLAAYYQQEKTARHHLLPR
ncbi:modification methylase NspV [Candidatus Vecturithrix granuli]|uniref:Modification methylase NspV n=1 Tax=Vecturithrix granuli TaxID=1499967 RepID=A0A0S6W9A2_VECG1|nr:modification methylase NspV [Candidatus Vecturithrix granuli]